MPLLERRMRTSDRGVYGYDREKATIIICIPWTFWSWSIAWHVTGNFVEPLSFHLCPFKRQPFRWLMAELKGERLLSLYLFPCVIHGTKTVKDVRIYFYVLVILTRRLDVYFNFLSHSIPRHRHAVSTEKTEQDIRGKSSRDPYQLLVVSFSVSMFFRTRWRPYPWKSMAHWRWRTKEPLERSTDARYCSISNRWLTRMTENSHKTRRIRHSPVNVGGMNEFFPSISAARQKSDWICNWLE